MLYKEIFSIRVKKLRKAHGEQQKELAEAIGVSQISLSTYEQGIRTPKPQVAKKIARVLGFEWTKFYEN